MLIAIPVRLLVFHLLPQEKGSAAPGRSPYYNIYIYIPEKGGRRKPAPEQKRQTGVFFAFSIFLLQHGPNNAGNACRTGVLHLHRGPCFFSVFVMDRGSKNGSSAPSPFDLSPAELRAHPSKRGVFRTPPPHTPRLASPYIDPPA